MIKHQLMKSANQLIIVFLFIPLFSKSQGIRSPIAAHYLSPAAYSKNFSDGFSLVSNAGALARLNTFSAGVYGERRFMLAAASLYTAVITIPSTQGNFALQANYFGYKDYNESQLSIVYGKTIGEKVDIGAKFNYYNLSIASYGNAAAFNFELGAVIHITDELQSGVAIYNPLSSSLGKNSVERLASVYKAALGYDVSAAFFAGLEIIKEQDKDAGISIGLQYKPIKQFFARTGVYTAGNSFYFGVGFLYHNMRLDITTSFHNQLGASPGILLLYQFSKKNKE